MSFSVNTNAGAMIALQNLGSVSSNLDTTQTRISTGLRVSSAKDDGGIFAIAEGLRADVRSYGAVQNSLSRGVSTVDTALAAGEAIGDLLSEMKEKALAASDSSLDTASRDALNEDFTALRDQITTIVDNAEFNGVNLLNGSGGITSLANVDGSDIAISGQDMTLGGSIVAVDSTADISTQGDAETLVNVIESSINSLGTALAKLGTGAKKLEIQSDFIQTLSDEAEKGIGNLVDANLAKESASLQALQVQQQLASQALSIANQAPNTVLSLFR